MLQTLILTMFSRNEPLLSFLFFFSYIKQKVCVENLLYDQAKVGM